VKKFFEPTKINGESFFAQKVFKAQILFSGFGMQLLDGIDLNPNKMVCVGIIHTQSAAYYDWNRTSKLK
jgi:Alpha adaptin AP2, C-terminal domain